MLRGLIHGIPALTLVAVTVAHVSGADSSTSTVPHSAVSPVLSRFLARDEPATVKYRALRHLDARCDGLNASAWMDVWTELDGLGVMQYRIVGEGGSEYIRKKVFRGALEGERKIWASGEPHRSGITLDNYIFEERGDAAGGLASLGIKARRKEVLLVDGAIFLRPAEGDLERIEGRLAKTPSFWIRRVDVVRRYERIAGVRMPVTLESDANLLFAGRSTFRMTYDYEMVNGRRIGTPQPRLIASTGP